MEIKNENLQKILEVFRQYKIDENRKVVEVFVGNFGNLAKIREMQNSLGITEIGANCYKNEFVLEFAL